MGHRAGPRLWKDQFEPGTGFGIAMAGYGAQVDGALTELSYYWTKDQSRIVPKAALEYVRASTGSFQEFGGFDPVMATGSSAERARILLGAEIGHYWIFDKQVRRGCRRVRVAQPEQHCAHLSQL